jgi:acetyl esterase/lipase
VTAVDLFHCLLANSFCFSAPWQILFSVFRVLVITQIRRIPASLFLVSAILKVVLGTLSSRQIQHLSPPTRETYKSWIQKKKAAETELATTNVLSYDIEFLESDATLLWVGSRHVAKKIVLFFHGGGYVAPLLPGHLEWCWRTYVAAGRETDIEVAVAVLEYQLCPEAKYPEQLRQAVTALAHILSRNFPPRNVIIGGDSAGGNLAAQVLCHLVEPHPSIPELVISEPLGGAFLVSPWLTQSTEDRSFLKNSPIDMLSAKTVDKSTKELFPDGHGSLSKLAFPLDRDRAWMRRLGSVLSHMYVTVGSHEVFLDQVEVFVDELRRAERTPSIRFDLQTKQAHDFILLESQRNEDGECIQAMRAWMREWLMKKI